MLDAASRENDHGVRSTSEGHAEERLSTQGMSISLVTLEVDSDTDTYDKIAVRDRPTEGQLNLTFNPQNESNSEIVRQNQALDRPATIDNTKSAFVKSTTQLGTAKLSKRHNAMHYHELH